MSTNDLRTFILYLHGIPGGIFPTSVKPSDTISTLRKSITDERQISLNYGSFRLGKGKKLIDGVALQDQMLNGENNLWYHIGLRGGADKDDTQARNQQDGKASIATGDTYWQSPPVYVIQDCENVQIGDYNTITHTTEAANIVVESSAAHLQASQVAHTRARRPSGMSEGELLRVLHSMVNPENSQNAKPFTLNELGTRFDNECSGKRRMKFKALGYGSMKNFLEKHPKWFRLVPRGQGVLVYALPRRQKKKMLDNLDDSLHSTASYDTEVSSTAEDISSDSELSEIDSEDQENEDDGNVTASHFDKFDDGKRVSEEETGSWEVVGKPKPQRLGTGKGQREGGKIYSRKIHTGKRDSALPSQRKKLQRSFKLDGSVNSKNTNKRSGKKTKQKVTFKTSPGRQMKCQYSRRGVPHGNYVSSKNEGVGPSVQKHTSRGNLQTQFHSKLSLQQQGQMCIAAHNVTVNLKQTSAESQSSKNLSNIFDDFNLTTDDDFSCLLGYCENSFIQYRPKHYTREHDAEFMRDVVSFWNTPNHNTSYIIVGVVEKSHPPHDLLGLDYLVDDEYYQSLFNDNFFSMRPVFKYVQKLKEEKTFGVIIISKIENATGPIYPLKGHSSKLWDINVIFYRDSRSAIRIAKSPEENQTVMSWFARGCLSGICAGGSSDTWNKFLESVDDFETGRAYCLITGHCCIETASVTALSYLPWIKIFDLDQGSRDNGLFSICEEILRNERSLYITSCNDNPKELSDKATEWCFLTDTSQRERQPSSEREWRKAVGNFIDQHCLKLAEFTHRRKPLTVVVLWYSSEELLPCLKILLEKLDERVSALETVFCYDKSSLNETAESMLRGIFEYLEVPEEAVHNIPLPYMCLKISEGLKHGTHSGLLKLPALREEFMIETDIAAKDAAWLKEFFDVLYLDYDHKPTNIYEDDLGKDFLRGGTLSWFEVKMRLFDVERDIHTKLKNLIQDNIRKGRSLVVSLFHAPGSGGTTVGRRMLWEIHLEQICPCVCVNSESSESVSEVVQRIRWLHDKTYLPVFVLVDSVIYKDIYRVTQLFNACARDVPIVMLYVQRYLGPITKRVQGNKVWLQDEVSESEARCLGTVFSSHCPEKAKKGLKDLITDVTQKGVPHCVYEFGLTAYDYEFRGTQSYVAGYLNIDSSKGLTSWQRVIGYLALVYYYGQMHIPGQFFCKVLNISEKSVAKLPFEAKKFVCESESGWRINLHAVAKEILEQILCPIDHKRECSALLSLDARKGLENFACQFIEEAGARYDNSQAISPEIMNIIRATFFFRNNRESQHSGNMRYFKRSTYSPIIMDIVSKPPYTERLNVLSLLSQKFPKDPSSLAHLGRFYANEREDFEKAKKLMNDAIKIRLEEIHRHSSHRASAVAEDETLNDVQLTRIYDMLGLVYSRQLAKLIDRFEITSSLQEESSDLEEVVNESLQLTKMACQAFQKCRENIKEGSEEEISYLHEIEARLQLLEFVETKFEGGYRTFVRDPSADAFIEESLSDIDMLLRECHEKAFTLSDHFYKCRDWYYVLFGDVNLALRSWHDTSTIYGRRGKIAAYRMKYNKNVQSLHMDDVHELSDLEDIISLYEENMEDVFERGIPVKAIDEDMKEWLCAIRQRLIPKVYSIEAVLKRVRQWYDRFRSPYSVYYCYVLLTVLAMGNKGQSGSRECFAESLRFKELLSGAKRFVSKPRRTHEWLGVYSRSGIRRLVHKFELGEWDYDSRFWKESHKLNSLLLRQTGTIRKCHRDTAGEIDMDIGKVRGVETIKCFFIPRAGGFFGRRFENRRVEFFVGFNIENGCNAFNVTELKKYQCSSCPHKMEISSFGNPVVFCKCGNPIRRSNSVSRF